MKNIFAALGATILLISFSSCREQEEMITITEAQSLEILKQATDDSGTELAPAIDSEGDPAYPPKR